MRLLGVAEVDSSSGRLLEANARLCEILGYDRKRLLGKTMAAITAPRDRDRDRTLLRGLRSGSIPGYSIEKRYVHNSGRHLWARVTALTPHRTTSNSTHLCIIEDITGANNSKGRCTTAKNGCTRSSMPPPTR